MMENYMLLTLSVAASGDFFYFQFRFMEKQCGQPDVFNPNLIFNETCLILPVNSPSEELASAVNCTPTHNHTHIHTHSVYVTDEYVVECMWRGRGSWLGVSRTASLCLIKHPPQRTLLLSSADHPPDIFLNPPTHTHHLRHLSLPYVVQTLCCSLTNNHIQYKRVTLIYRFRDWPQGQANCQ